MSARSVPLCQNSPTAKILGHLRSEAAGSSGLTRLHRAEPRVQLAHGAAASPTLYYFTRCPLLSGVDATSAERAREPAHEQHICSHHRPLAAVALERNQRCLDLFYVDPAAVLATSSDAQAAPVCIFYTRVARYHLFFPVAVGCCRF